MIHWTGRNDMRASGVRDLHNPVAYSVCAWTKGLVELGRHLGAFGLALRTTCRNIGVFHVRFEPIKHFGQGLAPRFLIGAPQSNISAGGWRLGF